MVSTVPDYFGSLVFDDRVMKARLYNTHLNHTQAKRM